MASEIPSILFQETRFSEVLDFVEKDFPHLRAPTEISMSTIAALSLEDLDKCPSVLLEGNSSAGKTTVLKFFYPEEDFENGFKLGYKSDNFTPAAFVSMDASKTKNELDDIDLLPRIKNKALLTPDLNTVFHGNSEKVSDNFSVIGRVLDGDGYSRDAGTQGSRGYSGDYKFVWIGATTPLGTWHYKIMLNTGSRLLMIPVEDNTTPEESGEEIVYGPSYSQKVKHCREKVSDFLNDYFKRYGVRKTSFDNSKAPKELADKLGRFGDFIVSFRAKDNSDNNSANPKRMISLLYDVARGHALLKGRTFLKEEDIECLIPLVCGSVPKPYQEPFKILMKNGKITRKDIQKALDCSKPKANDILGEFEEADIINIQKKSVKGGKERVGKLHDDYS